MSTATRSRTRSRAHLPRSQSHQAGIQQFTKTAKPGTLPSSKSLLLLDGEKPSCQLTASPSKKRKLNEITTTTNDDTKSAAEAAASSTQSPPDRSVEDTPSKTLKFSDLSVSTPRSSRTRPAATPTRSKTTVRARSHPKPPTFKKSTSTPNIAESATTTKYPAALTEFLHLHSCFLKALSLHSAHNEYSASADLRELLPSIEKIWKKRKVVTKDVQRLVQVWDDDSITNEETKETTSSNSNNLRFRLANYGLGKVCIERLDVLGPGSQGMFDENHFQERFVQILETKWQEQIDAQNDAKKKEEMETSFQIDTLPLAPIQACLTPFNTFRKGQQRLQDLKGGVIKVKTAMMKATSITPGESGFETPAVARDPTAERRKGLFERIKNKELIQSKLGPAPTKEQLLRRSAAQRAEDVTKVLALLRPSYTMTVNNDTVVAQRKPFSWQTLIQTIRDSLRNPIPAEEIAACLDILAQKDVAGDWIDVVTIGSLKSVVLMSARDISPKEIGIKVGKMQF
uniref:DNA replication factor Cdt1 C-terminal domain-containing protein n=1 Tax=Talaromyces marneffei PM1 TaxID=1077442 RepID=A0A093VEK3_TALMA